MADKFKIGIIELLESHGVTSLVRVTLESISSEGLLYSSPVRVQTTECLHSHNGTTLRELPLSQNLGVLESLCIKLEPIILQI